MGFRYEGHEFHVTALTAAIPVRAAKLVWVAYTATTATKTCAAGDPKPACRSPPNQRSNAEVRRAFDNHLLQFATAIPAIPATIQPYQTKL